MALLWTFFRHSMSFTKYGDHACKQYYMWGRTQVMYSNQKHALSTFPNVLLISPNNITLDAALAHCSPGLRSSIKCTPRPMNSKMINNNSNKENEGNFHMTKTALISTAIETCCKRTSDSKVICISDRFFDKTTPLLVDLTNLLTTVSRRYLSAITIT